MLSTVLSAFERQMYAAFFTTGWFITVPKKESIIGDVDAGYIPIGPFTLSVIRRFFIATDVVSFVEKRICVTIC